MRSSRTWITYKIAFVRFLTLAACLCGAPSTSGESSDVGIVLRGYEGSTLFPTEQSFESHAQVILDNLRLLSFGQVETYAIFDAGIDPGGPRTAQTLENIETCEAALAGWPSPEWDWMANNFPQLRNPTESQIALVQELIDWMTENNLPAREWASTETGAATNPDDPYGNSNYVWLESNVLRFSGTGTSSMLDGMKLPSNYDPADHDITLIVFSHSGDFNVAGAQLSLEGFGVLAADGSAVTGPAAYVDYSSPVTLDSADTTSVHEAVHAYGMGTHDQDPDTLHPDYSVMRQMGRIDTLPAANRMSWLNWLTAETVTKDPNKISDLSGAISSDAKYLLDIGIGADGLQRYQELFEGEWIQYRWDDNELCCGSGTIYYERTDLSGSLDSDGDGENNITDSDDDNDGLTDGQELTAGTDPLRSDTDGDGVTDKDEIDAGSDPLDSNSLSGAVSTGVLRIALEEPGQDQVHMGVGNLRGWAVATEGISRVEILIDGAYEFDAPYGGVRRDVASAFPDVPGSDSSGFSLAFNYSDLTAGQHSITAVAHTASGASVASSANFEIVRFESAFLGGDDAVSLDSASCQLEDDGITLLDALMDGKGRDVTLKWRVAEQGFEIVEIQ